MNGLTNVQLIVEEYTSRSENEDSVSSSSKTLTPSETPDHHGTVSVQESQKPVLKTELKTESDDQELVSDDPKNMFRERDEYYKHINHKFKDNPVTAKLARDFFFDSSEFEIGVSSVRTLRRTREVNDGSDKTGANDGNKTGAYGTKNTGSNGKKTSSFDKKTGGKDTKNRSSDDKKVINNVDRDYDATDNDREDKTPDNDREDKTNNTATKETKPADREYEARFEELFKLKKAVLIKRMIKNERNARVKDAKIKSLAAELKRISAVSKTSVASKASMEALDEKIRHKQLLLQKCELDLLTKQSEIDSLLPCENSEEHSEKMQNVHSLTLQLKKAIASYRKTLNKKAVDVDSAEKSSDESSIGVKRSLAKKADVVAGSKRVKVAVAVAGEYGEAKKLDSVKKTVKVKQDVKVKLDVKVKEDVKVKQDVKAKQDVKVKEAVKMKVTRPVKVKEVKVQDDPDLETESEDETYSEYLLEKQDLFSLTKLPEVSRKNSFFVETLPATCAFLEEPADLLHFADTLFEKGRIFAVNEHAHVDVVISPLWPALKERYVIFGNPDVKAINGFSIDSLREIYDLLQLNNYIYFGENDEDLNSLLFEFYSNMLERKNEAKYDYKKVSIFKALIVKWNAYVTSKSDSDRAAMLETAERIYMQKKLPLHFVKYISSYIYGRIILPEARKLTKYKGFSDKTYGELMSDFLTLVFDKCEMNSSTSYVDLGSGIGNTNFFASLSYNVKSSFGCEIMKNPSDFCIQYQAYFEKMLQVFGISNHTVLEFDLEKSFMDNDNVKEKLKTCDILLLNNFIFSPEINIEVTKLIKYLPEGAKIIHLKPIQTLEKQNSLRRRTEHINYNENIQRPLNFQESDRNTSSTASVDEADNKIFGSIKDFRGNDRLLITTKYQMPNGDMVSWTSNSNQYNYFITEISG